MNAFITMGPLCFFGGAVASPSSHASESRGTLHPRRCARGPSPACPFASAEAAQ
jgi:hypothetical protein